MEVSRNDPCPCGSGKKYKKCCATGPADLMEEAARRVRRVQESVEPAVLQFARNLPGVTLDDAREEFACGREDLDPEGPEAQLFYPWLIYDWHPELPGSGGRVGPSLALQFLLERSARLMGEQANFIAKVGATPLSFHEVLDVEVGRRVRLRDVLLQTEQEVFEKSGSASLRVGDILFGRIVSFEGVALMIGSGSVPLPPIEMPMIVRIRETLTRKKLPPTAESLRELEPELRLLYLDIREKVLNPQLPTLTNTDGDPIEFHTISCEVESADVAFQALRSLAKGVSPEEMLDTATFDRSGKLQAVKFDWLKPRNRVDKALETTVLGHVAIRGRKLTVDVNSAKRARRVQTEIRKRLGSAARGMTVRIKPIAEAMDEYEKIRNTPAERKRREEAEALQRSPEVQTAIREMMERHWDGWIDEPVPALSGKTPRQAVRAAAGREMVESLLLQFERMEEEGVHPSYDFNRIRKRLGLPSR